jgi:hypothetical protein
VSAIAQHDYIARVREEVANLERELAEAGARDDLNAIAGRLGLPSDLAIAAVFRAGRRSGLTLSLMVKELAAQLDRESRPGG